MSRFYTANSWIRFITWPLVKRWVRRSFPTVQTISTETLADWLAEKTASPVLIDTRKPDEYAVSHLPAALNIRTLAAAEAAGIAKNSPVVVYCSIGYRSGRLAKTLQSAGYSVTNLEGSIFQWANEGRSLVSGQSECEIKTDKVHPYNALWGLLLSAADRQLEAQQPD